MKIIFLDIDGVLNSIDYMVFNENEWNSGDDSGMIDPDAVALVNKIIEATQAKVVISSTWRLHFSLDELKQILFGKGFIGDIIDKTPDKFIIDAIEDRHNPGDKIKIFSKRGHEIDKWLKTTKEKIESFLILDDDSDMVHLLPFLVKTTSQHGITETHVTQAIKIFQISELEK